MAPASGGEELPATGNSPAYALRLDPEGLARVRLEYPAGRALADLVLLTSVHPSGGIDEIVSVDEPRVAALSDQVVEITQSARSSVWKSKRVVLRSYPDRLEYWCEVEGSGAIEEVSFFEAGDRADEYTNRRSPAGFWRPARGRSGWQGSLAYFSTVFNPSPNGAFRQHGWSGERQSVHPGNDPTWGGDWFFSPGPFSFGLGDEGRWLTVGIGCAPSDASFYELQYRGGPVWGLALTYQGYTRVDGIWRSPTVAMFPAADEYAGLQAYSDWLKAQGYTPGSSGSGPDWWREPIWCGWGEQVAREGKVPARELCTQQHYQEWLEMLESAGVVPGTIAIDDRWMASLGQGEPHRERWPALSAFIADRYRRGQRVLLWHNAWEVEDALSEGLIRTVQGDPARGVFGYPLLDPAHPATEQRLRALMVSLLAPAPHGLDADGLKVDITHSTPSGSGYLADDGCWGNALLHRLLALTYRLAKEVKPEALIECHAANPLFRDTADMLRLNDMHTDLRSVVTMMRHRARVARTAGWDLLDCDGWPLPSRAALMEYVAAQPELGVPALYYATRVDQSGEALTSSDLQAIGRSWQRYRNRKGSGREV